MKRTQECTFVKQGTALQTTALHQGLSKYLTAQDTSCTPTLTKNNSTLSRLGYLLSLQPRFKIRLNFFLSLVLSKWIQNNVKLSAGYSNFSVFPFLKQNGIT